MEAFTRKFLIKSFENMMDSLSEELNGDGVFGNHTSRYGQEMSWIEAFSRSMYGVAPYTRCTKNDKYIRDFNELLFLRLITDDTKLSDWDQRFVEMVPLVLTFMLCEEYTWDKYDESQKNRLINYLNEINTHKICDNNWVFFRIIVNLFLKEKSSLAVDKQIARDWKFIDSCYIGDGWYTDGIDKNRDYYIAFGYHYYSLMVLYLYKKNLSEKRIDLIRSRASLFADEYYLWFDNLGRMVAYGRSLIYRFASLSFWSALLINDIKPKSNKITYSKIGKMFEQCYQYWMNGSITNEQGILNLGYRYENELICESYNSAGSPYWSFKMFSILLLDEQNEFWDSTDDEKRLENEIVKIASGNAFVNTCSSFNLYYFNSEFTGFEQHCSKYMRFSYNSASGFNLDNGTSDINADADLVIVDNNKIYTRNKNIKYISHHNYQEFWWQIDGLLFAVTYVIPVKSGFVRIHKIKASKELTCYETGFAVDKTKSKVMMDEDSCTILNEKYISQIYSIGGQGKVKSIENAIDINIYNSSSIMPCGLYELSQGYNSIVDFTGFYESSCDTFEKVNVKSVTNKEYLVDDSILVKTRNIEEAKLFAKIVNLNRKVKNLYYRVKNKVYSLLGI